MRTVVLFKEGRKKMIVSRHADASPTGRRMSTNNGLWWDASNRTPAASLVIPCQKLGFRAKKAERAEGIIAA